MKTIPFMKKLNFSKKSILFALAAVLVLLLVPLSLKVYISIVFPEKRIKDDIRSFFKNELHKEIKFESVSLCILGNLTFTNLDVSVDEDFNDNISLVKTRRAKIKLDFISLIRRRIKIEQIIVYKGTITIPVKSGKTYEESLRDMFLFKRKYRDIVHIDQDNFAVYVQNARVLYRENTADTTLNANAHDVNISVEMAGSRLIIHAAGDLERYKSAHISEGSFDLDAMFKLINHEEIESSTVQIALKNFDLTYVNEYLSSSSFSGLRFEGGLSCDIALGYAGKNIGIASTLSTAGMNVIYHPFQGNDRRIISNANFDIECDVNGYNSFEKTVIRRLTLHDSNIDFSAHAVAVDRESEKRIDATCELKPLDLGDISSYITLAPEFKYAGTAGFTFTGSFDLLRENVLLLEAQAKLTDYSARFIQNTDRDVFADDLDIDFSALTNHFVCTARAQKDKSIVTVSADGFVANWVPFESKSRMLLDSPYIDADIIWRYGKALITLVCERAYRDKKEGYEDVYFLKKPIGMFFNSNDIQLVFGAQKIYAGGTACWNNLSGELNLERGILRLSRFALNGFGATYGCTFDAYLSSDFPQLKFAASVDAFDMGEFYRALKLKGTFTGHVNAKLSYETNGYRTAHFVDNAKTELSVMLTGAELYGTPFFLRMESFLKETGTPANLQKITIREAGFVINQAADRFSLSNVHLESDILRFGAFGTYDYTKGLSVTVPLIISIISDKPEIPAIQKETPLTLAGPLLSPALIKQKTQSSLTVYDIN